MASLSVSPPGPPRGPIWPKEGIYLIFPMPFESQLTSTPLFMEQRAQGPMFFSLPAPDLGSDPESLHVDHWDQGLLNGLFDEAKFSSCQVSLALWLALTEKTGTWRTRK